MMTRESVQYTPGGSERVVEHHDVMPSFSPVLGARVVSARIIADQEYRHSLAR